METPTKVAVVILNYNGVHWLEKFLADVVLKSSDAQVYVADNASTDDSVNYVKTNFPNVFVFKSNSVYEKLKKILRVFNQRIIIKTKEFRCYCFKFIKRQRSRFF